MNKGREILDKTIQETPQLEKDFGYKYPEGLDFRPTSENTKTLASNIYNLAQSSRSSMRDKYKDWRKIDKSLSLYIRPEDKIAAEKDKSSKTKEPIVIPLSYAIYDVLMTYLTMAFLEFPIFRYEGMDKFDEPRANILQAVVDKHTRSNKIALDLMTMFGDGIKYGIGPVVPSWKTERRVGYKKHINIEKSATGEDIEVVDYKKSNLTIESNQLTNIDPYQYLPDPNVPVHKIQDGQFVAWIERKNRYALLQEEKERPDEVFNCKYLKYIDGRSQLYDEGQDATVRNSNSYDDIVGKDVVDIINIIALVIPEESNLGDSNDVEKWFFRLAGDSIVIEASPLDLNHNKYPIAVNAPEFDGYSSSPISRLEMVSGIQGFVNWLIEARMANVKSIVNNFVIADPSLINMKDLTKPGYGKIVRMRRAAYGKVPIKNAIDQLNINDVTKGHMSDISIMENMAKYATGSTDIMMGIVNRSGSRISASESQGAFNNAASRLERSAMVTSSMAMRDIAYFFASHTQQFMKEEELVRLTGDLQENFPGLETLPVSNLGLVCEYDIKVGDGTIMDKGNAQNWIQIFQAITSNEALAKNYNIGELSKYIFKLMGAKNIDTFINQKPVLDSTENVEEEVKKGNLVEK